VTFLALRSRILQRRAASCLMVLGLLAAAGCGKKTAPPPPPPPPPAESGTAPTATITATPNSINAGDKVILNWKTTDASDVTIEGIGAVASAGTQTVSPTQTTDYHLVARGPGGSTDATAHVTVGSALSSGDLGSDNVDDATFHSSVADIFYDYDSYDVNAQSQAVVSKDAGFLASHPRLKIVIGGYCDARGSTEYNLALGENRANAAKQALVSAGVNPDRIRTVSYGKEKQFCTEANEQCYQQNRRAGFSVDR
jgi:peptidoglycan-associated lipoprotein